MGRPSQLDIRTFCTSPRRYCPVVETSPTSSSSRPKKTVAGVRLGVALLTVLGLIGLDELLSLPPVLASVSQHRLAYEFVEYELDRRFVPGVSERSWVATNGQGLRGDTFSRSTFNILLMGGSTTYCGLLDEADALHARVRTHLQTIAVDGWPVAIATSARGGQTIRVVAENLEQLVRRAETTPDVVVLLTGANAVERFYQSAPWFDDQGDPTGAQLSPDGPYVAGWAETFAGWYLPGSRGRFLVRPREAYREHAKVGELTPHLQDGWRSLQASYHRHLSRLHQTAREHGVRLLIVTQPINFGPTERRARVESWAPILHPPGKDRGFLPSAQLMADLLGQINRFGRQYSRNNVIPVLDLAALLADCGTCFYDQWHFTIAGADQAGQAIARMLDTLLPATGRVRLRSSPSD